MGQVTLHLTAGSSGHVSRQMLVEGGLNLYDNLVAKFETKASNVVF